MLSGFKFKIMTFDESLDLKEQEGDVVNYKDHDFKLSDIVLVINNTDIYHNKNFTVYRLSHSDFTSASMVEFIIMQDKITRISIDEDITT